MNQDIFIKTVIVGAAANSVVNPFIYSFLSTQFRQKLTNILERKIRKRKQHSIKHTNHFGVDQNTSRAGSARPPIKRLRLGKKTNEKKQLIQTNKHNEVGVDSPSMTTMSTTIVSSRCDL